MVVCQPGSTDGREVERTDRVHREDERRAENAARIKYARS